MAGEGTAGGSMIDWPARWRDDLAERVSIMESEGVPDSIAKAMADVERCRQREERRQEEMWGA